VHRHARRLGEQVEQRRLDAGQRRAPARGGTLQLGEQEREGLGAHLGDRPEQVVGRRPDRLQVVAEVLDLADPAVPVQSVGALEVDHDALGERAGAEGEAPLGVLLAQRGGDHATVRDPDAAGRCGEYGHEGAGPLCLQVGGRPRGAGRHPLKLKRWAK
jgi:hypothetical protein